MAAIIDLQNIVKIYQAGGVEVRAVCVVSLAIQPGEFAAIIGCLDQSTEGLYQLDGADVSRLSPEERAEIRNEKIGFVFQEFNLLARISVRDNVELPMLYAQPPLCRKEQWERANEALELVGLTDRADPLDNQLSGG